MPNSCFPRWVRWWRDLFCQLLLVPSGAARVAHPSKGRGRVPWPGAMAAGQTIFHFWGRRFRANCRDGSGPCPAFRFQVGSGPGPATHLRPLGSSARRRGPTRGHHTYAHILVVGGEGVGQEGGARRVVVLTSLPFCRFGPTISDRRGACNLALGTRVVFTPAAGRRKQPTARQGRADLTAGIKDASADARGV